VLLVITCDLTNCPVWQDSFLRVTWRVSMHSLFLYLTWYFLVHAISLSLSVPLQRMHLDGVTHSKLILTTSKFAFETWPNQTDWKKTSSSTVRRLFLQTYTYMETSHTYTFKYSNLFPLAIASTWFANRWVRDRTRQKVVVSTRAVLHWTVGICFRRASAATVIFEGRVCDCSDVDWVCYLRRDIIRARAIGWLRKYHTDIDVNVMSCLGARQHRALALGYRIPPPRAQILYIARIQTKRCWQLNFFESECIYARVAWIRSTFLTNEYAICFYTCAKNIKISWTHKSYTCTHESYTYLYVFWTPSPA